ncbi:MAG: hypothetical protein JSR18_15845 [Proteobacteria bacterium]|nr:hypothetical protein [Pseudomonadota bacterium]
MAATREELERQYHAAVASERKAFWAATAASFDAATRNVGAALGVEAPASRDLQAVADALWKEHADLEAECKRILAEAFPAHLRG